MPNPRHRPSTRWTALGLLALLVTMCASASPAAGEQTAQYDEFSTCPTEAPLLNNPAFEFAFCGSGTVHSGSFKIGDLTVPFSTPVHIAFGGASPNPEFENCLPSVCLPVSPGSTTLEAEPIYLQIPSLLGRPGRGRPGSGHGRGHGPDHARRQGHRRPSRHSGHGHSAHASHGFDKTETIAVTLELAGDIRRIALDAILGTPVPQYELPVKLRLSGRLLGPRCYIGSDSEPIVLAPLQTQQASGVEFLPDPNGFETEFVKVFGAAASDTSFAVPAAHDCGPGMHTHASPLDDSINGLFDLPSAAGKNEAVFAGSDLALIGAGYDGTPPDGGALLQATFDAAK